MNGEKRKFRLIIKYSEIKQEDRSNKRRTNKGTTNVSGLLLLRCLSPTWTTTKKHTHRVPVTTFPDAAKRQIHRPQAPSGTQAEHSERRWPVHPRWDPSSKAGVQVQSQATGDISEHPRTARGNRDLQHEGELRRAPAQRSGLPRTVRVDTVLAACGQEGELNVQATLIPLHRLHQLFLSTGSFT